MGAEGAEGGRGRGKERVLEAEQVGAGLEECLQFFLSLPLSPGGIGVRRVLLLLRCYFLGVLCISRDKPERRAKGEPQRAARSVDGNWTVCTYRHDLDRSHAIGESTKKNNPFSTAIYTHFALRSALPSGVLVSRRRRLDFKQPIDAAFLPDPTVLMEGVRTHSLDVEGYKLVAGEEAPGGMKDFERSLDGVPSQMPDAGRRLRRRCEQNQRLHRTGQRDILHFVDRDLALGEEGHERAAVEDELDRARDSSRDCVDFLQQPTPPAIASAAQPPPPQSSHHRKVGMDGETHMTGLQKKNAAKAAVVPILA